jgi:hypothetical protein
VENAQVSSSGHIHFYQFYVILGKTDNFAASGFVLFLACTPKKTGLA